MSGVDLLAMYRDAKAEVFRLEAQERYDVEAEAGQIRAFEETGAVPSDPAVEESMAVVRAAVDGGTHVYRAHVVDLPLSPYMRYELAAYAENLAVGEDVSIAVRSRHPGLAALGADFVLFDPGTDGAAVVWMDYDAEGHLTGTRYSGSPADIARAVQHRDAVMAHAVPLREFTALAEAV
jgi:hypothetical protein